MSKIKYKINEKVGKLTILEHLKSQERSKYLCKCDCGQLTEVLASNLKKNTRSCGCMIGKSSHKGGRKIKYKIGYKFKNSLILERIDSWNFKCKCICNNEFILTIYRVWKNKTDCGCLKKKKKPMYLTIYWQYQYQAKKRKIEFNIEKEIFNKLIFANCHYCNIEPQNHIITSGKYKYEYKYNGLDRVNSNLGYEINNVVTCCKFCNRAKNNEKIDSFLTWLNLLKGKSSNLTT